MSALVTHLLIGALVALALRWEWKWVPLGMLLAELPDIDHFGPFSPRVELHNLAFTVLLPLLVLGYLIALDVRRRVDASKAHVAVGELSNAIRIVAGAPALLASHLFLDLFQGEVNGGYASLFYPFHNAVVEVTPTEIASGHPEIWSTFTVAMAGVLGLVAMSSLLVLGSLRLRTALVEYAMSKPLAGKLATPIRVRTHALHEPERHEKPAAIANVFGK